MIASVSVVATAVLVRAERCMCQETFQSVQAAIDAADGATIVLGKGVHRGGVDMRGKG